MPLAARGGSTRCHAAGSRRDQPEAGALSVRRRDRTASRPADWLARADARADERDAADAR